LIAGYILTLSVYAFTFGHYTAYVFDFGEWLPRVLALGIILLFALINLHGVSNSSKAEILMVWVKLLVLVGIACYGLSFWSQDMLSMGDGNKSLGNAIIGAATIFMAYEGFQLLSYDYDDIDQPQKTLPRATFLAIISVIAVYILVALGATMIVGADVIAENKEVALAIAGKEAFGFLGLAIVTIAVAFSTGSAINATLFSTARLAESVAKQHDLPQIFFKENDSNIPLYSIGAIAALAAVLSVYGSLSMLVDSASLIFLITFSVVNFLAYIKDTEYRIFSLLGAIGCVIAIILSVYHQLVTRPLPLFFVMGAIITILTVGTWVLKKLRNPVKN
jgi:amino acid transporter